MKTSRCPGTLPITSDTQTTASCMIHASSPLTIIPQLCRGNRGLLQNWLTEKPKQSLVFCIPAILLGCGAYGFTMGLWHGWQMASYVAIKLPLVIFATLLINGMINGMLAMALGSGIGFRQSIQFLLAGFGLMSNTSLALSPPAIEANFPAAY